MLAVSGFTPASISLSSLLPQGVAGCSVIVGPDVVELVLPTGGIAQSQLALPNAPYLVGLAFDHQFVPAALDPLGNIIAVTSSNALTLTVGSF